MDHHPAGLLTDIGLGIIFAAALSHAARLLRQPLILGYVLGGVLLGSNLGFGLVTDEASIELISEIGLILLLFIIGLEINLRELRRMGKAMVVLGLVQFAVSALLAAGVFRLWGAGAGRFDLLYIGVALALSSTLIVVKLLHDKFEVHTVSGRLTVGVLVLQDLWAIIFMALQPNLQDPRIFAILRSWGLGALLVTAAFAVSRYALGRLFQAAARSPELVLLTSISWCFLVCGLAERAGLSKEMGALIAGLTISAFPYGADVTAKLSGVRDFFVTLFFVSLGLKVPRPDWALAGASAAAALLVVLTRLLSVVPAAYLLRMGLRTGTVAALNLSQISEFSLVILSLGAGYGHVSQGLQSLVLTSMLLSAVLSTYLILFNDRLAGALAAALSRLGVRERSHAPAAEGGPPHGRDIVVLGCHREALHMLEEAGERSPELKDRVLVIDYNPSLRPRLESMGFAWAYGDLGHPETLQHLGVDSALVVLCSVSDVFLKGTNNRRLLRQLQRLAPRARHIMVADDRAHAEKLMEEGAHAVVMPWQSAGNRMLEALKEGLPAR